MEHKSFEMYLFSKLLIASGATDTDTIGLMLPHCKSKKEVRFLSWGSEVFILIEGFKKLKADYINLGKTLKQK